MQCKWCGVERDAPAAGPHVCDPQRVRERALREAGVIAAGCLDQGVVPSRTIAARILDATHREPGAS